jgi:hypothetical protein
MAKLAIGRLCPSSYGTSAMATLGEQVIFCKLIRDGALRHLNPWKLSDLQCVLEMRCFEGLLSDEDLKEVYFQRMWGFKEGILCWPGGGRCRWRTCRTSRGRP